MMRATDYQKHIEALGLSQGQAAAFLKINVRTARRFETEGVKTFAIELLLRLMVAHNITPEAALADITKRKRK